MQLTKGAIGNLINRYTAVLKKCHLMNTFGSLAVAGMLVMGGAGVAVAAATAGISVNTNTQHDEDVNITGAYDIGVYASGAKADFSGKQLHIATTPGTGWGSGNVGLWADSTAPSDDRSVINFGQVGATESINIAVTDNAQNADTSIGVWSRGDQNKAGGKINLNAETVTIKGHSNSGWIYGIYAQNATTTTEYDRATININAGKTYIDVTSGGPGRANAIVAMSQGVINIESDLYVNTQGGQGNAIVTRGDSIIAINSSGTHTVQMNGNVNFNYDGPTSGTKVDADVDITLSGADSYWNGNTLISWNGTPSDSSKLDVSEMTLTVKDGATWTPTAISNSDSQKYTALNKLTLDGGIVGVNKDVAITIENIGGKGAITNAGSVTIEKGSIEGPITFEKGGAQADSMVTVGKDGKTTLTGGVAGSGTIDKLAIAEDGKTTITNAKLSGHVGRALWNNGTLTVNDGRFESNKANVAGAIYNAAGAELTVDGVTFANNSSNNVAGAINNRDGKVIITKSTFKDNSVPTSTGGAINNTSGNNPTPLGTITITGSTFEGNKAGNGGAVWNGSNGKVEIADSTFKGNTALAGIGQGGAITNADQMTITGSTFEGNQAGKIGGAIFNAANGSITFNGTNTFTNNTAAGKANDIHNSGAITVSSGTTTLGSGYSQNEGSLTVNGGAALESLGTMEITGGSVAFKDNSLFAVNGNNLTGNNAAISLSNNASMTVGNTARLRINNAKNGQTYSIVKDTSSAKKTNTVWRTGNIETSSDMLTLHMKDDGTVSTEARDASEVFTGMDGDTAAIVNGLYGKGLNNTDADQMGVRFLSRATDNRFLGMDKNAAAESIESAARIAFAGAAPQMTRMASDAATNSVVNRLGFANPADGAQAMDAEGKIVDRNTTGFALWIAPLWQSQHGWGLDAGNMDYGFNGNLGGVSLGADYTFENAIRAGITFNIGGGYAESSGGDLSSTENRMNFWGLGAYAGWNYENFGVMADVSYTSTWNQLKQDLDSRLGMGNKLEADVQASAISAGLRAEYLLQTSAMDIIPHIGVRYMSLNTWGYDVDTHGGTVLEGDSLHQDIWTFPIGVTFSKDFALDSGWSFKPSLDFTVIPAAGDIKAKHDVHFTGLPGTYEVETQMMDYLTWQGGVGLELANDNMSIGVNYTLQAGQHTTGHGVFGSFRYEF